jgi:hypothetical protein
VTTTDEYVASCLRNDGVDLHDDAPLLMRNVLKRIADRALEPDAYRELALLVSVTNTMKKTKALAIAISAAFTLGTMWGEGDDAQREGALALLKAEIARDHGRDLGRVASAKKRQAVADERDRAAFYDRWWEKRGKHLQAGIKPRTTKNDLMNKIVADLEEKGGGRGCSDRTVRVAINRWEKNLLVKPTGGIVGR